MVPTSSIWQVLGFLANAVTQKKKDKLWRAAKKKIVTSLFMDDMLVFLEYSKESFESLQVCWIEADIKKCIIY